ITVTFPDGSTEETIVGGDGHWSVDVPGNVVLKPGEDVKAKQEEPGKKPSDDTTKPVVPLPTSSATPPPPGGPGGPSGPGNTGNTGNPGGGNVTLPTPSARATPRPSGTPTVIQETAPPLAGFIPEHIQYINGYPDGSVMPDADITRAETAAVIFRLLSDTSKSRPLEPIFYDVPSDAWYKQSVAYLTSIEILHGYPEGDFRPDAPITRAEFATMISGFDQLSVAEYNRFPDVEGHWAVGYINSAATKGWVSGYPDGTFGPENNLTRAEIVTVINRMLSRRIEVSDIPDWAPDYNDLTDAHWAYADMIEASIGHEFTRKRNDFERWTRQRDWSAKLES
ncbi:MAG: S-layer homology domain-containing protein, partial [Clostridiales bacterium]|nr:S-layer homology domain-containing protein [Clostridiales bacterium]